MKNTLSKSIKIQSLKEISEKSSLINKISYFKTSMHIASMPITGYKEINDSYRNIMDYYKNYKPYNFLEHYTINNSKYIYNLGFGRNNLTSSIFERSKHL